MRLCGALKTKVGGRGAAYTAPDGQRGLGSKIEREEIKERERDEEEEREE